MDKIFMRDVLDLIQRGPDWFACIELPEGEALDRYPTCIDDVVDGVAQLSIPLGEVEGHPCCDYCGWPTPVLVEYGGELLCESCDPAAVAEYRADMRAEATLRDAEVEP